PQPPVEEPPEIPPETPPPPPPVEEPPEIPPTPTPVVPNTPQPNSIGSAMVNANLNAAEQGVHLANQAQGRTVVYGAGVAGADFGANNDKVGGGAVGVARANDRFAGSVALTGGVVGDGSFVGAAAAGRANLYQNDAKDLKGYVQAEATAAAGNVPDTQAKYGVGAALGVEKTLKDTQLNLAAGAAYLGNGDVSGVKGMVNAGATRQFGENYVGGLNVKGIVGGTNEIANSATASLAFGRAMTTGNIPLPPNPITPNVPTKPEPLTAEISEGFAQLSGNNTFAFNSATLTAQAKQTLDNIASALTNPDYGKDGVPLIQQIKDQSKTFDIKGFTDAFGDAAKINNPLSDARAEAVRSYLASKMPEYAGVLTAEGYGERGQAITNEDVARVSKLGRNSAEYKALQAAGESDRRTDLSTGATLQINPAHADTLKKLGVNVEVQTRTVSLEQDKPTGMAAGVAALANKVVDLMGSLPADMQRQAATPTQPAAAPSTAPSMDMSNG
ncbi:OmpA family protein, partial [Conchiformibius steedae]|uniref:OmpA family protein n=1 Tax=Conchiformibius steedae TaxID=153493 RepID=UPI0026E92302